MAKIRKLELKDRGEVESLMQQLTGKKINIDAQALIDDERCICHIVELESRVVGFGCLTIYLTPEFGKTARIEDVIVDEEFRGNGFGRQLVESLLNEAKSAKIKTVNLTSNPMRTAARSLYKKLGFKKLLTDSFTLELK